MPNATGNEQHLMEDIQKILTEQLERKLDQLPEQTVYSWPRTSPAIPPMGESACRLIWAESASSDFNVSGVDGKRVKVRLNHQDLIIAPGNSVSLFASEGRSFAMVFYPDFLRLANYHYDERAQRTNCISRCDFPCSLPQYGFTLFHMLHVLMMNQETRTFNYCIKALISMALARLHDPAIVARPGKARYLWLQIENYLRAHQNENLSREDVARLFHRNPCYVSVLCRANTNMPFSEYARRLKIENAPMLLEKDLQEEEIAAICGFSQTNYFIRVFKAIYGMTPGQYRKKYLSR